MKKILVFVLLCCTQLITAQDKIYEQKDIVSKPKFPGGKSAFEEFVETNFKTIKEYDQPIIVLDFIVEKNGTLTGIKIVNPKNTATEKEALRVMKLSPKWFPAATGGKPVRCHVVQEMKKPDVIEEREIMLEVEGEPSDYGPVMDGPKQIEDDDNQIYNTAGIEVKPDFPGGLEKFYKFFNSTFRMPNDEPDLKGKVFATFVIEKDGSLSDIKIIRDIGYGTGREVLRVLRSCPKWNPGMQNGKKVRVLYSLPFPVSSDMNSKTDTPPLKVDEIKDKNTEKK